MTRFGLALGIVLAAGGCGLIGRLPPPNSVPSAPEAAAVVHDAAETAAAPECVRVSEATLGFSRMGGNRGYFWVGYTAAGVGQGDLEEVGGGDGFTFGAGFKLSDASHTFLEFALEKTLKHSVDPEITPDSQGIHERTLVGLRTTTAARARLQNQPRPYVSYGMAYNNVCVRYGTPATSYIMNGVGCYLGLGCEFPSEGQASFSFDAKAHTWNDDHGNEGTYGALTYALLWFRRF